MAFNNSSLVANPKAATILKSQGYNDEQAAHILANNAKLNAAEAPKAVVTTTAPEKAVVLSKPKGTDADEHGCYPETPVKERDDAFVFGSPIAGGKSRGY